MQSFLSEWVTHPLSSGQELSVPDWTQCFMIGGARVRKKQNVDGVYWTINNDCQGDNLLQDARRWGFSTPGHTWGCFIEVLSCKQYYLPALVAFHWHLSWKSAVIVRWIYLLWAAAQQWAWKMAPDKLEPPLLCMSHLNISIALHFDFIWHLSHKSASDVCNSKSLQTSNQ